MQRAGRDQRQDFFVSFANADKIWAEWITWQLKSAHILAKIPNVDLQAEQNFAQTLPAILSDYKRILVILSLDYLSLLKKQLDWVLLLQQEAQKADGLALLVQVRECHDDLYSLFGDIPSINLVGLNELEAHALLLGKAHQETDAPTMPLSFDILQDETVRRHFQRRLNEFQQRERAAEQTNTYVPNLDNLPYSQNPLFIDREDIFGQLEHTFFNETVAASSQPIALCGLAGIGKTQIALTYAHRNAQKYRHIFWINARESLVADFVKIAKTLKLPERNRGNQATIVTAVKYWLQTNGEWLLVLDDVELLEEVNDVIPLNFGGHILLTTQLQSLGTIAQYIPVGKLSAKEAATFLLLRIHAIDKDTRFEDIPEQQRTYAKEITRQMDGLPLAIDQAGAYIEETHGDLSTYNAYYAQHLLDVLRNRGNSPVSHTDSVIATWTISFERLAKTQPAACQLLCFCAFLAINQIPEEIITHIQIEPKSPLSPLSTLAQNPFVLDRAINELRKYSLISRNPRTKMLHMHGLVQSVIRRALEEHRKDIVASDIEPQLWIQTVIRAVSRVFPEAIYENWEDCERYVASAIACANLIEQWQATSPNFEKLEELTEAARLLHEAGTYLFDGTQYIQAERLYTLALEIRKKLSNPDELAASYNDLGWLHRTLSKYESAFSLFDKAWEIRREHSSVALPQTLNDLAWLYYNEGKYVEAEDFNQRALDIRLIRDDDKAGLATSLNNLAWIQYVLGKYEKAENNYLEALAIRRDIRGNHPYTATILDNLALLYQKRDRYTEAETFFREALEIRSQALGENHPDVAHSLNGLGFLYFQLGNYELAADYYTHALHIHQRAWTIPHPHVAHILTNQAQLAYAQGHYSEAEQLFEQARSIRIERNEMQHPEVARILSSLARLYRRLGQYDKAEQYYADALSIRQKVFHGLRHPDIAQILNDQAGLFMTRGAYKKAEQLYGQALMIREEIFGADHLDVAQTLTNMIRLYRVLHRYAEAERHGKRAITIWEQRLGPNHHYLATILNNLGELYQAQEKYTEARMNFIQALTIQEHTLGVDHPDIALTLNHLAALSVMDGQYEQAEAQLRRALAIREQKLGPEHPYLAYSLEILAEIASLQQRFFVAKALLERVIDLRISRLGPNHPNVATSYSQQAKLYEAEGNDVQAKASYAQALSILEICFGKDYPDVLAIRQRLNHIIDPDEQ